VPASLDYGKLARANGVLLSVGMAGECWDNAVAESFFATIKRELIDTRAWPTRAGLRAAVFDYIEGWYNTRRLSPGVPGLPHDVALVRHLPGALFIRLKSNC
jgi:transposase InsO family protein